MIKQVLLVDDDVTTRRVISSILTADEYKISEACNLQEARAWIEKEKFNLVLLDLSLPDGNGLDFCKELRQKFSMTQLPILIVTAQSDEEFLKDSFANGANDYLTKPISRATLQCRVQAHSALSKQHHALLYAQERIWEQHRMEGLGTLACAVGHNFNNLLSIIRNGMELIQTISPPSDSTGPLFEKVIEATVRAAELTAALESFGGRDTSSICADPVAAIKSALEVAKATNETRILYSCEALDEMRPITLPVSDLVSIVIQLVQNAAKAIEKKGEIKIQISDHADGFMRCSVSDTGHGIPKHLVHKIFEPFSSFQTGDRAGQMFALNGSGLGLFATYNFIKRVGGDIKVIDTSAAGTTIEFHLPFLTLDSAAAN